MEEINDFESFYNIKIAPFIETVKSASNEAGKWKFAGIVLAVLSMLCFILKLIVPAIVFLILLISVVYKYNKAAEAFTDKYKETIVNEIIKYLNPGIEYKPSKYIASKDYRRSGLFRHIYENYDGNDFMKGVYRNVRFFCCELETAFANYNNAPLHCKQLTIFKGLFFEAPVSSSFSGGTYVWPKGEEQLPRSMMDEYYRLLPLPNVSYVKMSNGIFNSEFSVCSTNPYEARMILSGEMMERILKFKHQINREIRLSVVGGVFYIAISINENLLEPSMNDPGSKEKVKEYFFSILLVFSIISQLNLSRLT